jgi:hypothetical protein
VGVPCTLKSGPGVTHEGGPSSQSQRAPSSTRKGYHSGGLVVAHIREHPRNCLQRESSKVDYPHWDLVVPKFPSSDHKERELLSCAGRPSSATVCHGLQLDF